MYKINFQEPISVHFIGIGGISMSGLAEILLQEHFPVSGSDAKQSDLTKKLEMQGASVFYGQKASNIPSGTQLVVYTAAIHPDNPELKAAQEQNIPCLNRAQLLGQIMDNYKNSIGISGTHGKTTTTSMAAHILLQAQTDPTVSVGGILKAIQGNIRVGTSDVFLTEACEYTNSFLHFSPKYEVILNIEEDHMDFFHDIEEIRQSFHSFALKAPKDGVVIVNGEIPNYSEIITDISARTVTYGFSSSHEYYADNIQVHDNNETSFSFIHKGKELGTICLQVPGLHNVSNALAAATLAMEMKLPFESIATGLYHFEGTKRRFEWKGKLGNVSIVDDYAHHPTEITATLQAAKNYPADHIICVFQPHTYSRTKAFLKEFAIALSKADIVVLADIYAAREQNTLHISSKDLLDELKALGTECYYFPSFDEIENFLLQKCANNDLLITMGAGDIVQVGEHLLGR